MSATAFRRLLKAQGYLSANDFCTTNRIHRNTLRAYLSGEKSVFADVIERISEKLSVDPLDLLESVEKGLEPRKRLQEMLKAVFRKYSEVAFILIGSRSTRSAKEFSDFDIALSGGEKRLATAMYLRLKQDILDATEPFEYSVDVINLDQAPIDFLRSLESLGIFMGGDESKFDYYKGFINGIQKQKETA